MCRSDNVWINLVGFQLGWWSAILYGNAATPVLVGLIVAHLVFHPRVVTEGLVVLICGCIGFMVDSLLTFAGIFVFSEQGLPPLWLFLLWFIFVSTLRQSLGFFRARLKLAILCGGLGGGGTYIAAAQLGAVELGYSMWSTLLILFVIWTVLFPALLWFSRVIDVSSDLRLKI